MTITAAGIAVGNNANNATSVSNAADINVTAGQLLVIWGMKYSPTADPFVAGDCTKLSGTATIDTPTLDRLDGGVYGGVTCSYAAVWSCIVTGSGTLRMQVGGALNNSFMNIATEAFNSAASTWDSSRVEAVNSAFQATDNQTPAASGNVTSVGGALFVGGLSLASASAMTITPDGAFTQVYEEENGAVSNTGSAIYRIVTGGTTDQAEWTVPTTGNFGWAAVAVVYKEVGGGGGVTLSNVERGRAMARGILRGV